MCAHSTGGYPRTFMVPTMTANTKEEEKWYKDITNISSFIIIYAKNTKTIHQYRKNSSKERYNTTVTLYSYGQKYQQSEVLKWKLNVEKH